MRVTCEDLDSFLENLRLEPPSHVLQQAVRVSISHRPLDSSDKHKAVKFDVVIQASAVVSLENGGEYLLDYGENCGIDYRDVSNELTGSLRANALRGKLVECCDDLGLRVRPGIVHE